MQQELESPYKRRERLRDERMAQSYFEIGEKVAVRGQVGTVAFYIPEGKTVWQAWDKYSDMHPEAEKATANSFYSRERLSTHRYFVELMVLGKPRIFCPYLHNMQRLDS